MAWLEVNKDGSEGIFKRKPHRTQYDYWTDREKYSDDSEIKLPKGAVNKLIGRDLTYEDEPIELKEVAMSKQVLDVQQMQHLQELGLELDYNVLYRYVKSEDTGWLLKPFSDLNIIGISCTYIPAYTLQDVLDALPASIGYGRKLYVLKLDLFYKIVCYREIDSDDTLVFVKFMEIPLIDAAYDLLCWTIERGYVETNKNE